MRLDILRSEANGAASAREHILTWSAPWHGEGGSLQLGTCDTCGAEVQIATKPAANGIGIGGPAVAINCEC